MTAGQDRSDPLVRRLRQELADWSPRTADQRALRAEYARFLADEQAAAVDRDLGRAHITASAFVFTPDLHHVLLGLHKKAGFWLQLGGHIESTDDSVRTAAHREAQEEGGISELVPIGDALLDLDLHDLGPGFTRCDTHWDIGYGFLATGTPTASAESDAVGWWPVDALPRNVPVGFESRVRRVVRNARR